MAYVPDFSETAGSGSGRYSLRQVPPKLNWVIIDSMTGRPAVLAGRLLEGMSEGPAREIYSRLVNRENPELPPEPEPIRRIVY
jgi:hypothetical protein